MSEAKASRAVSPWLEEALTRHLGPVAAPNSLWDRLQEQPLPKRHNASIRWPMWAVAAVMLFLASSKWLWHTYAITNPHSSVRTLASQQLRSFSENPEDFEFYSEDPTKIQSWIQTNTGLHIDLPMDQTMAENGTVKLFGVRKVLLQGQALAEIGYYVAGEPAMLLVSKTTFTGASAPKSAKRHLLSSEPAANASLVSWNMGDQVYALAFSGIRNPQKACLLCHAEER